MSLGYGLNQEMLNTQRVNFHSFEGNKNGSPKEHKFRVLPAYAPNKLFHKVGLHWGFKDAEGKQKAITCTLEAHGSCPICDKVNQLKGQLDNIDAALTTQFDPQERAKLEAQKKDIEEYVGDHRRKPMYIWNIVTETGEQKVLQLSWNGHDPLFEKIKFIFNNQGIDVTSATNSVLLYCNRSGLKAKTRYQYEMLAGFEKDLTKEITTLTNLEKVYVAKSLEYVTEVVTTEMVPSDREDPNDRNFDAEKPQASAPPANAQQPMQQTNIAPTQAQVEQPVNTPDPAVNTAAQVTSQSVAPQTEAVTSPHTGVQLTPEQDDSVAQMMAALNQ